jgi:hypothetical protein
MSRTQAIQARRGRVSTGRDLRRHRVIAEFSDPAYRDPEWHHAVGTRSQGSPPVVSRDEKLWEGAAPPLAAFDFDLSTELHPISTGHRASRREHDGQAPDCARTSTVLRRPRVHLLEQRDHPRRVCPRLSRSRGHWLGRYDLGICGATREPAFYPRRNSEVAKGVPVEARHRSPAASAYVTY